ncbi:chromosome partitioning protein [Brachybacterium phenoliresistens]|uniref:chromosome partitioning protein n=1 Tax=Brachybacterium phenoliresistens TaxID=396014 RepID=UPI0031DAD06F
MIAQARIASETRAAVHLASETIELHGANLTEVRARVKQVFINASRRADAPLDVVIVEGETRHHLRVEPSGRIAARPADSRPVHGPALEPEPASAPGEDLEATVLRPLSLTAPAEDTAKDTRSPWAPLGAGSSAVPAPAPAQVGAGSASTAPEPAPGAVEGAAAASAASTPAAPEAPPEEDSESTRALPVIRDDAAAPTSPASSPARSDTDVPTGRRRAAPHEEDDALAPEATEPSAPASSAPAATSTPAGPPRPPAPSFASGAPASAPAPTTPAPSAPVPGAPAPAGAPSSSTAAGGSTPRPLPAEQAMSQHSSPTASTPSHLAAAPEAAPAATAPAAAPHGSAPAAPQHASQPARPTLQDLQSATTRTASDAATRGWQGFVHRLTGGAVSPAPGRAEAIERENLARVRKALDGPKNIAVVNLKGGAHKTTASLMIAATLGVARGGSVLAWDNNETRGTLGWRGRPADHQHTALDLLHNRERLQAPTATVADLDQYVRPQGDTRFDILASDEDPGSASSIDGPAFEELNSTLSRFYRLKVIDTGNNVRASNWLAAVHSADQLVIISTVREDTFNAAAWMIDELRATGLAEQVDHAVTILSHSSKNKLEPGLQERLHGHFSAHTRAVTEVPYEHQFVDGSPLDWGRIAPATKDAWLAATALIVDGL